MTDTRPMLSRSCTAVALAFALAGCGSNGPLKTDTPSIEQRLLELERRMERLEARLAVEPPYRSKAEIRAHIRELEAERSELMIRYLPQHPAIRDLDRRLGILDTQLKMLE